MTTVGETTIKEEDIYKRKAGAMKNVVMIRPLL